MTTGGVVALTLLLLTFLLFGAVPLWHTDFWAHLKYGEWIAAHRALPEHEPLNPFTDKQARMFDAMWLTQVGYHGVYRAGHSIARGDDRRKFEGGIEAIRLVHLLATIAAIGLLGLTYRRVADSVPWATVGMLIVLILLSNTLTTQRPQTFAFTCFAAILFGLSRPLITRRAVVWIPFVMILWANLHGSFVVGFGLLGLVFFGRLVEVGRESGSVRAIWQDPACRRLLLTIVLGLVGAGILNPYGPSLYLDVIRFGDNPNVRTMSEWQALDFSQLRGGHWGYLAIIVLLAVTQLLSPKPFTPTQLLLIITFGLWPLFQQRAMSWWVPLVPWIIAPHWVAVADRWGLKLPESVPSFRKTALAALLVAVVLFISPSSGWVKTGRPRPTNLALQRGTPNDIAAALAGQPVADPDRVARLLRVIRDEHGGRFVGRIFSSEIQGEYLLWSLPDDTPVMMYNHAQFFPVDYWSECLRVKSGGGDWWEILDRHRAGVVVVEVDMHPELCAELRTNSAWQVVLDEEGAPARDLFSRLFVAVRKPAPPAGKAQ
jgi:hypothetical protein